MVNVISVDVALKAPGKKVWEVIRDSTTLFPKILPSTFKSIEVVSGDGKSAGSVRQINYADGSMKGVTFAKEKLETVDDGNMYVTVSVIDSELLGFYKIFKTTLKVLPGVDANSCTVKWHIEFEGVSSEVPPPETAKEAAVQTFKAIEGYILATA
uniref:Bet v I/Major latex protein domain-containing protein n=1 Tax=Araucaria cunninghamii TaxID=56994 RepID=A0A0D6QYV2_ARACU